MADKDIDDLTTKVADMQIKKKRVRKTLYWAVHVEAEIILKHEPVQKALEKHTSLVPLTQMHSTLVYVGRKEDIREKEFEPHKDKMCQVVVSGHGVSEDALALNVSEIKFVDDDTPVPTYASIQHITTALKKGVKAVDSIKSFSEGEVVVYEEKLVLTGKLRQYFY